MRDKARERQLSRVCTLLDDVALGERHETILHLLHSARRESRERNTLTAQNMCIDALSQLRKARHSMRVRGAAESEITRTEYAIALLLPVHADAQADSRAMMFAQTLTFRILLFMFVIVPLISTGLYCVLWGVMYLFRAL